MTTDASVVLRYQQALDQFRREGRELPLLKKMSELISLLDLSTTLSSGLSGEEILEAALLIVMGELRTSRGALLVKSRDTLLVKASRGLPPGAPESLKDVTEGGDAPAVRQQKAFLPLLDALGLEVLCPIRKRGERLGFFGLGARREGGPYREEEMAFLRSVAACSSTPIENGLMYSELRKLNQSLSFKVFQLNNLFDISRELTASFDPETIKRLVTATLMGHLMASRCALYMRTGEAFALVHQRGLKSEETLIPEEVARPVVECLVSAMPTEGLPDCLLKQQLIEARMAMVAPIGPGPRVEGFLAVGERASGAPFSDEDRDFTMMLSRQAHAALENVRLHRVEIEKQRQDEEMHIAREIQQSLFPKAFPAIEGYEVAARSDARFEVGGDHYDVIPLYDGRIALVIADVSGKGAPASLLMASVHAWLRALAGSEPPATLFARLNRFLYENTQTNRYVTMFYAEFDPRSGRLRYVNGGHIPPYRRGDRRGEERLEVGGPVLGLLEDVSYSEGEALLGPGDTLTLVTDGVTEAASSSDEEFGDARCFEVLRESASRSAEETVGALAASLEAWTGGRRFADDATIVVLKAVER